ncbi:hypothetical protein SK3146_00958 [Paenibacillus konkukensis]|uniref:Lipoprotein n=1 Tax=Paenibacillus konkukensis TaxID=2020716 RepID=A0ABY4RKG5_9BACL|nr:hypothetical protein [Paenibacillus konkukensis]UQZ81802.1 hypothetical protein SK3146_00958 [Paenibacillus konkukensis]
MKRFLVAIAAVMMLLSLVACNSAPAGSSGAPAAAGNKVLFVGRDSGGDGITAKRLKQEHGLEVTVVADKELTAEKANGMALIYVSESVNSNKIKDIFVNIPIPVVYAEPQSTSDTGMADVEAYGSLTGGNAAKTIEIKDGSSPLAAGLQGKIDVYKDNGKMGFAIPGKEAIVVATVPGEDQKATIFAYDKGVKNVKGNTVAAREVYFYMFEGEEINQTDDGWKLFDAAVQWALGKK